MPRKPSKSAQPAPDRSAAATAARRGPRDPIHRLQDAVWLATVDNRCPVASQHGKDIYFLGEAGEGTRTFWRIQRDASDPGLHRASLGGGSVVGLVGRRPGYFHTRAVYASELFQPVQCPAVLGPDPMSGDQCDALIKDVLKRLDLVEVTGEDAWLASGSGRFLPEFAAGTRASLQRWLQGFTRKRNIDHILLLCLLYKRAVGRSALDEAIVFRNATIAGIQRFCRRPGFSGDVQTLWLFLTHRRVFMGQRSLEHAPAALAIAEQRLPAAFTKVPALYRNFAWHRWLMAGLIELETQATWTRLVTRTQGLDSFERDREALLDAVQRESLARLERDVLAYFALPEDRRVCAATRLAEMRGHVESWRKGDY